MNLHAEIEGAGTPLVLLHGFAGNRCAWKPHYPALEGFRVIAVDLPGHGRSPAPGAGENVETAADAVVEVLDREGIAAAFWLGYSMGGRVALAAACRHPDRVQRLLLESASPGLPDQTERAHRRAADEDLAASIERDGMDSFVERWAQIPLFASQKRLPADILARERRVRLQATAPQLAAGLRALGVGRQPSYWSELARLEMPTAVVVGEEDAKYLDIGRRMVEALPDSTLHVVPEAGHRVHLEKPERYWSVVRAFARDGATGSAS